MNKEQAEANLILLGYAGSITYGTNTADSDTDIRGIFIPSKENWLGLHTVEQVTNSGEVNKENGIDYCYYGIRKFFELALNANPNILECLWLRENHYLWNKVPYPSIGRKLIENRDLFLSKKARFSYCGYAYAQVKRLKALNKNVNANKKRLTSVETYGFDTKNALHCIRLMRQGLEILVDGELNVFRHDAQFLLDIKAGKYTYEQIVEMFNEYEHLIEGAYVRSSLPHKPNFDKAEKLLVEIVEEFLYG